MLSREERRKRRMSMEPMLRSRLDIYVGDLKEHAERILSTQKHTLLEEVEELEKIFNEM